MLFVFVSYVKFSFFFFQAEDGIRDGTVTGVQTCALPIYPGHGGIIKPPRPGQAELQQLQLVPGDGDALPDMCGEPAHLTDRVPVLLTFFWRAHPADPTSASPRARQCRGIR